MEESLAGVDLGHHRPHIHQTRLMTDYAQTTVYGSKDIAGAAVYASKRPCSNVQHCHGHATSTVRRDHHVYMV